MDPILPFQAPGKDAPQKERDEWLERLKDSRILIDLSCKILVFLEATHLETFNILRPILSHDDYQISYRFTNKSGKGQLQTQHVVIQGWPATIFCSTQEKYVQDLASRGFTITPETSEEKYKAANILTGERSAFPWLFEHDEDFMLLEGYITFLKDRLKDLKVVDPYAKKFAEVFSSKFARSMRDFKHLLNLIGVHTLFHFAQRPILVRKIAVASPGAEKEELYIMPTKDDYDFILALWNQIRETTETSTLGHVIKFYHEVVEKIAEEKDEFTAEDMTERWNSISEDKRASRTIRMWAEFLCNAGYLTSRTDPTDRRREFYKVISHTQKNSANYCNLTNCHNWQYFEAGILKKGLMTTIFL